MNFPRFGWIFQEAGLNGFTGFKGVSQGLAGKFPLVGPEGAFKGEGFNVFSPNGFSLPRFFFPGRYTTPKYP